MDEIENKIHRTWIQLLIDTNYNELAATVIDSDVSILYEGYDAYGISIDMPTYSYGIIATNEKYKEILSKSLLVVSKGYIRGQNGYIVENPIVEFRIKLLEIEEGWKEIIREKIAYAKQTNQSRISEIAYARQGKELYTYNEIKFASQSEIRVAQELENRKVLFFPLALAVRADTGKKYQDHREVDFLVCHEGVWGIIEVSFHPNRFEKDAEKDSWFKKSGILCIQHYSAERCFQKPSEVVDEFLDILLKHKK